MEKIDKEQFDSVKMPKKSDHKIPSRKTFKEMLKAMQNPIEAQKELAVQIKIFLDDQIETEIANKGKLSESTRRWVKEYNSILEKLQRSIYGDKSVSIGLVKITHSHIGEKIRKYA